MTAREERELLKKLLRKAVVEFDELWIFRDRAPDWVGRSHWYTRARRHLGMKPHSASGESHG